MKKIIGFLVCTLLIVTSISVTGQIKEILPSKDYQEIITKADPDFIVHNIVLEYAYGGDIGDRVAIQTGIDNIGSLVEKMSVRLRLSFEDYPEFTTDHVIDYEGTGLKYHGNPWPGLNRPLKNKCIYTLIVEVDPDNEILESNDENNVKTKTVIFLPRFNEIFNKKVTNDEIRPLTNGDKWMKTYDLNYFDAGYSVQQTSDEGFILVGSSHPSADDSIVWLVKTDSQGNIIWDKKFGGEDDDYGSSVKQTNDGGYIIAGRTWSFGNGKGNIWLIKTDNDGIMVWNKTFSHSGWDYSNDVIQTVDNGYIIAGFTGEPGEADALLIKTDEFGNLEWELTFGDSGEDGAYSVAQTLDGGYIVSGYMFTEENNEDVWLFRTDGNGEMLWEKTFFTDDDGIGFSVKLTDDGGFIITGVISPHYKSKSKSYITGKNPLYGNSEIDILLFKTDSDGELLWYKKFGGEYESWGWEVYQTNDGGYIIIGNTVRFFGEDALLIKTNSDGEKIWSKTYGDRFSADITSSGQQTSDGGYILAGYKYSVSNSDFLLIKTDSNGNVPNNKSIKNTIFLQFLEKFPLLNLLLQRLIIL